MNRQNLVTIDIRLYDKKTLAIKLMFKYYDLLGAFIVTVFE